MVSSLGSTRRPGRGPLDKLDTSVEAEVAKSRVQGSAVATWRPGGLRVLAALWPGGGEGGAMAFMVVGHEQQSDGSDGWCPGRSTTRRGTVKDLGKEGGEARAL